MDQYLFRISVLVSALVLSLSCVELAAQPSEEPSPAATPLPPDTPANPPPAKVDVEPMAADTQIADRLQRILEATGWFHQSEVRVDEGVVFFTGTARDKEVKDWAGNLARRTQDVVAVVNNFELQKPMWWDLTPATLGMQDLWLDTIRLLPFLLFGMFILIASFLIAWLTAWIARKTILRSIQSDLLRTVLSRLFASVVLLLGIYVVLRVSGLTRLALTVVGGTGLFGLVIGIAFRDITENFLASIFLSTRRPYLVGDLVEIVGIMGFVQRLTTRSTELITLDGNHVEIPNSTVFKNTIRNYSTNKNVRCDFTVTIGYDASIDRAQELALKVLRGHQAVLADPEPLILVESLTPTSVILKIYFWMDAHDHSMFKVKSSILRLLKQTFEEAGIALPPAQPPIASPPNTRSPRKDPSTMAAPKILVDGIASDPVTISSQEDLSSEAKEIEDQARQSRKMEGDNLLTSSDEDSAKQMQLK